MAVALVVLGAPQIAQASWAYYFNGHDINGAWKSSYDRASSNKADSEGSGFGVQVKTNGLTSSGYGEVVQSYGRQTAWEYCRVSSPLTVSVGLTCQVNMG